MKTKYINSEKRMLDVDIDRVIFIDDHFVRMPGKPSAATPRLPAGPHRPCAGGTEDHPLLELEDLEWVPAHLDRLAQHRVGHVLGVESLPA